MSKFITKTPFAILPFFLYLQAEANTAMPISPILDTRPETRLFEPIQQSTSDTNPASRQNEQNEQGVLNLQNFEELVAYPEVLERLFDQAVLTHDMSLLEKLIPIYQKSPKVDTVLLTYGQALLTRHQGNIKEAIVLLEKLSQANPEHKPIKFQLAMTQMMDKRHKSAKASFAEVKADPSLPVVLSQQIDNYQARIKDEQFDGVFGLRYLDNDNVNNAPRQSTYGNWTLPTPQSARGVGYSIGGRGKTYVTDHVGVRYSLIGFGKYYWDNKDYNDHTTQATLGATYETAKHSFGVSPSVSQRRFGGKSYSKSVGIEFSHSTMINPKIQASHSLQISDVKHTDRKHLDGVDGALSGTWVRGLNMPFQYIYGGYNVMLDNAKDDSDKSIQAGVRFGVGRQWGDLLMTDGSVGIYQRHYQGEDLFQIKRRDHLYTADVSLWRKDWQYKGFVPKFVVSYEKTDSNHFMYDNDSHEIYLTLQKMY